MTLPLSGPLEASDINVELGRSATDVMSITDAATGVYATINTCSPYFPNGTAPHAYSEWYGYNHLAPCLNSNFAFSPVDTTSGNFLRSDTLNYETRVSSSKPDPTSQFTLSMWIKIDTNIINTTQGYITFLAETSLAVDTLLGLIWFSFYDSGTATYHNIFQLDIGNGTYQGFTSIVDVSDVNNATLTGVPNTGGLDQTGFLDTNGYFLLTCVVDYNNFSTVDYVRWYWNDTPLDVPFYSSSPGSLISGTTADSPVTPDYTGYDLVIGALYAGEISSGCLIDGYSLFIDTALSPSDVTSIYNGGAVAPLSSYTSISSRVLFYNFESDNPNLGNETGGNYAFNLDEINFPARVQPPAA
jgi:hypothetical protein